MTPSDLRERVASLRDSVANAIIKDFSNCSFACDPGECTYRNITPGKCACRDSASVIIDLVLEEADGPTLQVPSYPDRYIMPPDNLKTGQDWELHYKLEDFALAAFTKHHSVAVAYLRARNGNQYSSRDIQMMCQGWALAESNKAAAIRALKEKNDPQTS